MTTTRSPASGGSLAWSQSSDRRCARNLDIRLAAQVGLVRHHCGITKKHSQLQCAGDKMRRNDKKVVNTSEGVLATLTLLSTQAMSWVRAGLGHQGLYTSALEYYTNTDLNILYPTKSSDMNPDVGSSIVSIRINLIARRSSP